MSTKQYVTGGAPTSNFINVIDKIKKDVKNILKNDSIEKIEEHSIYDFISYHIADLSASKDVDKVESLKELIMMNRTLALAYLNEQCKIDDPQIVNTFETIIKLHIDCGLPNIMNYLLQFIEIISFGGGVLTKLSNLVVQLIRDRYTIRIMNEIIFKKIFNNLTSPKDKDLFIYHLISNGIFPYESISIILNDEKIIIDLLYYSDSSSIRFFYDKIQEVPCGSMNLSDITDFALKIIDAIRANETGGGKLKNLVSVIEFLFHKKIVFTLTNLDESTFIKMINNFDNYYTIILLTKNLLDMNNNNLSYLNAKNTILRQQISFFLSKNICCILNKDDYYELSFIYGMLDYINLFECHNKNDISKLPDSYFPNFNDKHIRRLLLQVMNHPEHQC